MVKTLDSAKIKPTTIKKEKPAGANRKKVLDQAMREVRRRCGDTSPEDDGIEDATGSSSEDGDRAFVEDAMRTSVGVAQAQDSIDKEALLALARIRDGTFGLCQQCFKPIQLERLSALPYATLCIQHAWAKMGSTLPSSVPRRPKIDLDNLPNLKKTEDRGDGSYFDISQLQD
ncbi:hypothetical protein EXS70_04010 [Candidatus Peribacteria bacterium]|nr:hypothetical protein [Candidatus Peribacteria bacterium]